MAETRGKLYSEDPENLVIVEDAKHPLFDKHGVQEPLNESLVRNIMFLNRVIEPIQCIRDGKSCIVVNGRQRVKACREANKRLIKRGMEPVRIRYEVMRDKESTQIGVMLSANEHRRTVSVIERADKCAALTAAGRTLDELSAIYGVTPQTIGNWMKINSCCAKVRDAVESGAIRETAAAQLSGLEKKEQEEKLVELLDVTTGKPTVRKARTVAAKEKQETLFTKPSRKEIETELESCPQDAKDVLLWILGKAKKPW